MAAQKQDGPDARDTKIRIGNTMPYSGSASAYGVIGQTEDAYFKMVNDQGGINRRKIEFIFHFIRRPLQPLGDHHYDRK